MPGSATLRQLIVCGFHRSGTSLTMQALKNAGLYAGDNLMSAHPSNPDGHFEDTAIVKLHDAILASVGRSWLTAGDAITSIDHQFTDQAGGIIDTYSAQSVTWGFKDPRTCLFLDWWHSMLPDPAAVLIYRDYISCYHSLRNRQAQILSFNPERHSENLQFWKNPLLGLQLWLDYNHAVLAYTKKHRDSVVLVSCEAMLSGYDLVAAVNRKFSLALDADSISGIRSGAGSGGHVPPILTEIPADLRNSLNSTLQALNELADSSGCAVPGSPSQSEHPDHEVESACTSSLVHQLDIAGPHLRTSTKSPSPEALNNDNSARSVQQHMESLIRKGCVDEAFETVKQGLSDHPENLNLLLRAGKLSLDKQLFLQAECYIQRAHRLHPNHPSPLRLLGILEFQRNHFLKASHLFAIALAVAPEHARLYLLQARALAGCGRFRTALVQCNKGLNLEPDNVKLKELTIKLHIDLDLIKEAKQTCQQAMNDHPSELVFMRRYGELTGLLGDTDTAIFYFYQTTLREMQQTRDYQFHLNQGINSVSIRQESLALRQRINHELRALIERTSKPQINQAPGN